LSEAHQKHIGVAVAVVVTVVVRVSVVQRNLAPIVDNIDDREAWPDEVTGGLERGTIGATCESVMTPGDVFESAAVDTDALERGKIGAPVGDMVIPSGCSWIVSARNIDLVLVCKCKLSNLLSKDSNRVDTAMSVIVLESPTEVAKVVSVARGTRQEIVPSWLKLITSKFGNDPVMVACVHVAG
jgi:hypothetical protein